MHWATKGHRHHSPLPRGSGRAEPGQGPGAALTPRPEGMCTQLHLRWRLCPHWREPGLCATTASQSTQDRARRLDPGLKPSDRPAALGSPAPAPAALSSRNSRDPLGARCPLLGPKGHGVAQADLPGPCRPSTPRGSWVRVLSKEPWAPRCTACGSVGAPPALSSEPRCLAPSHGNGPQDSFNPRNSSSLPPWARSRTAEAGGAPVPSEHLALLLLGSQRSCPTPTPGLPLAQVGTSRSRKAQAPKRLRAAQATAHLNSIEGSCSQQPQVCDVRKTAPVGPARRTTRWLSAHLGSGPDAPQARSSLPAQALTCGTASTPLMPSQGFSSPTQVPNSGLSRGSHLVQQAGPAGGAVQVGLAALESRVRVLSREDTTCQS